MNTRLASLVPGLPEERGRWPVPATRGQHADEPALDVGLDRRRQITRLSTTRMRRASRTSSSTAVEFAPRSASRLTGRDPIVEQRAVGARHHIRRLTAVNRCDVTHGPGPEDALAERTRGRFYEGGRRDHLLHRVDAFHRPAAGAALPAVVALHQHSPRSLTATRPDVDHCVLTNASAEALIEKVTRADLALFLAAHGARRPGKPARQPSQSRRRPSPRPALAVGRPRP